mmetsp:Transcript_49793/g.132065  ORF Transcript_49793/g.132065 Transcript_49793/m.132065 type:complete len:274 (-) Transcript_49793:827-1648(-)
MAVLQEVKVQTFFDVDSTILQTETTGVLHDPQVVVAQPFVLPQLLVVQCVHHVMRQRLLLYDVIVKTDGFDCKILRGGHLGQENHDVRGPRGTRPTVLPGEPLSDGCESVRHVNLLDRLKLRQSLDRGQHELITVCPHSDRSHDDLLQYGQYFLLVLPTALHQPPELVDAPLSEAARMNHTKLGQTAQEHLSLGLLIVHASNEDDKAAEEGLDGCFDFVVPGLPHHVLEEHVHLVAGGVCHLCRLTHKLGHTCPDLRTVLECFIDRPHQVIGE